jgi:hypothetical protein
MVLFVLFSKKGNQAGIKLGVDEDIVLEVRTEPERLVLPSCLGDRTKNVAESWPWCR